MPGTDINLTVMRRRAEYLAAAASGKKWVAPGLILQLNPIKDVSPALQIRYGLTASRKVGNAVLRNRARRRMRALAKEILPPHATPGHDYVLIARGTTITRPYQALREDLVTALKKLKAWRDV